jgi:predicted membrane protein
MNKQIARIGTGLIILAIGVGTLLGSLNIINFSANVLDWWPLLVIATGLMILLANPRQFVWPLIIIGAGVLLQLRELDIVNFHVWRVFWPILIIAFGLSVIFNRTHSHKNVTKKELDEQTAVFAGSKIKNESKDYKGGNLTAIFGGVELDLREADIKTEATVNISAIFGGVTLLVPLGWTVKSKIMPIAGGVENKTVTVKDKKNGPVLYLAGDVFCGGVEVKHQ